MLLSQSSSLVDRVACHCNREKGDVVGQQSARKTTIIAIIYPVQQVELDTDGIPLSAIDFRLAGFPNLLEGVETPGTTISERAENCAQVVTEDDIHEIGTVNEACAVENVVILCFDLLLREGTECRAIGFLRGGIFRWWRGVIGVWEWTRRGCIGPVFVYFEELGGDVLPGLWLDDQ